MDPSVVKVTPGKGYVLSIVFDNGERGTLAMREFLLRLSIRHVPSLCLGAGGRKPR